MKLLRSKLIKNNSEDFDISEDHAFLFAVWHK